MSEKSFAFASVSVAIVMGVFFYPPPAPAARSKQPMPTVGPLQQAHASLAQTGSTRRGIGVD